VPLLLRSFSNWKALLSKVLNCRYKIKVILESVVMKHLARIRVNAPLMILIAAILSSSCGMLGAFGSMGSLASMAGGLAKLTDDSGMALEGTSPGTTLGYEVTTSGMNDQKADAGYLYGIWKAP
jgi:hypothetical protein